MAYNRRNKLLFILDVQQEYMQHKAEGVSTIHVYRTYIKPRYRISLACFYNYLSTPASAELKRMDKASESQQMCLQFS